MAETKKQQKESKEPKRQVAERKAEPEKKPAANVRIYLSAALVIIFAAVLIFYLMQSIGSSVPFSTFKSNFQGSQRVSLTVTYTNLSQYSTEVPCFTSIIQIIAHSRKASTIDFFQINQQNMTCTYSTTGLGGSVSLATSSASYCLNIADKEPGIFLNYSNSNYTQIGLSHMYVYGNSQYMSQCPIAIELN